MNGSPESDIDIEELLDLAERHLVATQLKRDNPYVRDLIRVLWPFSKGLSRQTAIDRVWKLRSASGVSMPTSFDNTVQSAFNQHNEASAVFHKSGWGADQALFYPYGGKGSGKWAIHHERAAQWLKRKALADI